MNIHQRTLDASRGSDEAPVGRICAGDMFIVDDDAAVARTLAAMVGRFGIAARVFTDAESFFTTLESYCPAYVAVDLLMPGMDGVEVLRRLAEFPCDSRIIVASGLGGRIVQAARQSAKEHGLNIIGSLEKPFSLAALQTLLATAVKRPAGRRHSDGEGNRPIEAADIQDAIEQRELFPVYQPKISCKSGAVQGFETLVRWHHPERGLIMPGSFIPLAEQSSLMNALTVCVLDQALEWYAESRDRWERHGTRLHLSLNLSARNLQGIAFADDIAARCVAHGVSPAHVVLELTETCAMEDPTLSLDILTRLRMKGFLLSIDDFGTGYSSMAQLVRLPFTEIKVDRSFVMTSGVSAEARTAVRSIVELGRSLGMVSTAEGVEDEDALQFLREIGCDFAQGYHIARPLGAQDALSWVESNLATPRASAD